MQKIDWENGTVIDEAHVIIDSQRYNVVPEEYDGATPISAENLNEMQDNIEAEINSVKTLINRTNVLWTGAWHMNANQTITLSENVLDQKNGIILVWSSYSDGQAQDYDFNYTFVPKKHVEMFPGAGVSSIMGNVVGTRFSIKYLYIGNSDITGNVNNGTNLSNTAVGINFTNTSFVLRYVLGI